MSKTQYIIIGSNVIDGLTFWGPFDSDRSAIDWADVQGHDFGPWQLGTVNSPDEEE